MTSNQAFQSRGQKRRRSTTWRGVRRGRAAFPGKVSDPSRMVQNFFKKTIIGVQQILLYLDCCPKTSLKRKFVNQAQTFFFCSLDFSLFDMFFNVSFSVSLLTSFGTFFLALPNELRVAKLKVILVPTASQGISDVWRGLGYIGEASLVV